MACPDDSGTVINRIPHQQVLMEENLKHEVLHIVHFLLCRFFHVLSHLKTHFFGKQDSSQKCSAWKDFIFKFLSFQFSLMDRVKCGGLG